MASKHAQGLAKKGMRGYYGGNCGFILIFMGQKIDARGFRIGINRSWDSLWFSKKNYADFLKEDLTIRAFLERSLQSAGVSRIVIERAQKKPRVTVFASRPGVVIGKKGVGVEQLLAKLKGEVGVDCAFNIVELRKPELYAQVVANDIASQIERRVFYKRAMRKAIQAAMKMGALGIKIHCSGRLGGVEIARTEGYNEGRLPLHSLRSDIDFACGVAHTQSGACGVKVWIYRGDVLDRGDSMMERRLGEVSLNKLG
jgi:small subunit ribosomal protein S3